MKAMKSRVKGKSNSRQKSSAPAAELSSFSLAAAISEASSTVSSSAASEQLPRQQQPRKIFNISSFKKNSASASQASLATNTSFATANESQQAEPITPASYFVDSSDDETNEGPIFGNDPLAVLSRTNTSASETSTPTEISININPEETMPSKKSKKISPVIAEPVPVPTTTMAPKDPPAAAKPEPTPTSEEAHFDVAQNVYGWTKDVWAWGTTVPVISNLLGITEAVAAKVVDVALHTDLPAIDQDAVVPQLKKLDGGVIDPVIAAVWKIVEPALHKSDEMIVKPVMTEVVPRVLAPLSMFDQKKKDLEAKKKEEAIDAGATPEIIPALN